MSEMKIKKLNEEVIEVEIDPIFNNDYDTCYACNFTKEEVLEMMGNFNEEDSLVEEVEQLRKDRDGAVKQMSKSWQHNHENQSDLLTRYVEMANSQFEIMERLRGERDVLERFVKSLRSNISGSISISSAGVDAIVKNCNALLAKIKG